MEYRHFIGNAWKAADNGESLDVVDPSTGEPFASIARGNAGDIDIAVTAARNAMGEALDGPWAKLSPVERANLLFAYAAAVTEHAAISE